MIKIKKSKGVKRQKDHFKLRIRGLTNEIKKRKVPFAVYIVLRTFVIIAMIISFARGNYEQGFVCVLSLILFLAPAFITANFNIEFPSTMEVIVFLFIFAAEILGEVQNYYIKFQYWDVMLHTVNGFLCAACGFGLVDILNKNPKIKFKMSPFFLAMVSFCFSMTIGVLWEFFEFGCDAILHTDTQKDTIINMISSVEINPEGKNEPVILDNISEVIVNGESLGVGGYIDIGLIDTMQDLFVNFIGAVVFSVIGFFYVKSRGKGKFVKRFIPTLREKYYISRDEDNNDIADITDMADAETVKISENDAAEESSE